RSFRKTVALIDRDSDAPEKFTKRSRERRPAGTNDAQAAARSLANFLVDQLVGQSPLQRKDRPGGCFAAAPGGGSFGNPHRPGKNLFLQPRGGVPRPQQPRKNFSEDARTRRHNGRTNFY